MLCGGLILEINHFESHQIHDKKEENELSKPNTMLILINI